MDDYLTRVAEAVRKLRYYGEVTPSCDDNPTRKLMREAADLLAATSEAPQVAVQDRRAEACLTAMDHISTETLESFNRVGIKFDATRGYAEELEAEIATLREQNAALVAALEGVLRWIDHWAQTGPGMDFERVEAAADAALACVKGGAV